MYVALPNNLELRKSNHSPFDGLFAKEFIPTDTVVGVTHIMYPKTIEVDSNDKSWSMHGIFYTNAINNKRFLTFEDNVIRTPLGGFLNREENGNCGLKRKDDIWILITLKDIDKENELFVTTLPDFPSL